MVYRFLKSEKKTLEEANPNNRFPKIVLSEERIIVKDELEFSELPTLPTITKVIEPETTPFITVSSIDYPLLFGRDFDTAIFTLSSGNMVVNEAVGKPLLEGSINISGNADLFWSRSFEQPSQLYRTEVYLSGDEVSDFSLIAKIDGTSIPGIAAIYVDESVNIPPGYSVSYLVTNGNGTSNTLTLSQ